MFWQYVHEFLAVNILWATVWLPHSLYICSIPYDKWTFFKMKSWIKWECNESLIKQIHFKTDWTTYCNLIEEGKKKHFYSFVLLFLWEKLNVGSWSETRSLQKICSPLWSFLFCTEKCILKLTGGWGEEGRDKKSKCKGMVLYPCGLFKGTGDFCFCNNVAN